MRCGNLQRFCNFSFWPRTQQAKAATEWYHSTCAQQRSSAFAVAKLQTQKLPAFRVSQTSSYVNTLEKIWEDLVLFPCAWLNTAQCVEGRSLAISVSGTSWASIHWRWQPLEEEPCQLLWSNRPCTNCQRGISDTPSIGRNPSIHILQSMSAKNNYCKFPLLNLMSSPRFLAPFSQWRIDCITQKVDNRVHWINFTNILWGQNFARARGEEQAERWHESRLVPVIGFNTASCKGKYCPRQQQATWLVCWNPNFFQSLWEGHLRYEVPHLGHWGFRWGEHLDLHTTQPGFSNDNFHLQVDFQKQKRAILMQKHS